MKKPINYSEIIGQDSWVQYSKKRISKGTFPKVTLYTGEEGIGKTSLMYVNAMALTCQCEDKTRVPCGECHNCKTAKAQLTKGSSTTDIQVFRMSIEGGKEAAQESIRFLNTNFTASGTRVIIYDECHAMSAEAQDVLLTPLESLPDNVYVMFATTNTLALNRTLYSRMLEFAMKVPSKESCVKILKKGMLEKGIKLPDTDYMVELIADWAENKPRQALQILESVGDGGELEQSEIEEFTDSLKAQAVADIIVNMNGSIVSGIQRIMSLKLDAKRSKAFVSFIIEAIKVKMGQRPSLPKQDTILITAAVNDVKVNVLVDFLYEITRVPVLTNNIILSAYLKNHSMRDTFLKQKPDTKKLESAIRPTEEVKTNKVIKAPTLNEIIEGGSVVE